MEALSAITLLIEKSKEWGGPLWVVKTDIHKAFDKLYLQGIIEAMQARGVPPVLVLGFARELTGTTLSLYLDGVLSLPVLQQRGSGQGRPDSPTLFTAALDEIVGPLSQSWARRGFGFQLRRANGSKRLVNHICFVDDILLVALSRQQAETMLRELDEGLRARGLQLSPGKCVYSCNEAADAADRRGLRFRGAELERCEALPFLGTLLDLNASTNMEFEARLRKGWGAFWNLKDLLLRRSANLPNRIRLLNVTVFKGILWGSQCWKLTEGQEAHLRSVQNHMVRKMMRLGRGPEEQWIPFYRRTLRAAHEAVQRALGGHDLVFQLRHLRWGWAGHLARLDEGRLAKQVANYRSLEWWRDRQEEIRADRLRYDPRRRPGPGRPALKWEEQLEVFAASYGATWTQLAADRLVWASLQDVYARGPSA